MRKVFHWSWFVLDARVEPNQTQLNEWLLVGIFGAFHDFIGWSMFRVEPCMYAMCLVGFRLFRHCHSHSLACMVAVSHVCACALKRETGGGNRAANISVVYLLCRIWLLCTVLILALLIVLFDCCSIVLLAGSFVSSTMRLAARWLGTRRDEERDEEKRQLVNQ